MGNLDGKVAIVTGAGRGIGQQIAKKLAEAGAKVAVVDLQADWCRETVDLVEAAGSTALALGCNVAESAEVDACVKRVIEAFGTVDILVNNAGITKDGLLMRMSDADWDAVLNVNLKGTFLFTRAVAPGFIQSKMTDVLPDDVKKAYMDTIPLKRFGTAEDIAQCVAFLASPAAAYITGQVISVNGGMIG